MVIVALTLFGAALHEVFQRRELAAEKESARIAKGEQGKRKAKSRFILDPAVILIFLVTIAGLGTAYFAGTMGLDECKAEVKAERQRVVQERIKKREQKTMFQEAGRQALKPGATEEGTKGKPAPGTSNFQGLFSPDNLEEQAGATQQDQEQEADQPRAGTEQFQGIFAPKNLEEQAGGSDAAQNQE